MFEKLEELAKNNKKISDFHIRAGAPLAYRQTGEIIKVQEAMVTAQDIKDLLSMNCNEHELNKFDKTHELDKTYDLEETNESNETNDQDKIIDYQQLLKEHLRY